MTFAPAVPILFSNFVYPTNVYWSVIHGIKRKPYLLVVWNWYHFVWHQPRPTDSADINTWLQLSDTSSIPPMHGGFLLGDEMDPIFQTTFSNGFSGIKMYEFRLQFHWSMGPISNITALVLIMAWHRPGNKPLSEKIMVSLLMHICITRPQWVNPKVGNTSSPWSRHCLSPKTLTLS